MRYRENLHSIALTLFVALLLSCSSNAESTPTLESEMAEVVIAAAGGGSTRTELDPDDLSTVRWSVGDKVAIWATGESDNTTPLVGEEFTLRYYGSEYDHAEFSSSITPMSEDQRYSYKAFYPYTSSLSGTSVTYKIPASQSGEYDGSLDFRVADAVLGSALSTSTMGGCELSFRALTHVLKISIPDGYNDLGVEVKELRVTLPADVAGVVSFDMANTEATPTIASGASQTISLIPSTPIDAGDGQSLWLFINPMSNVNGTLSITGVGVGDELAYSYDIPLTDHTFAAGHITPIYTAIGEEIPSTTIELNVSSSNIGEDLTYVHLTAPTGGVFKESGESTYTIANDGTGLYKASYITDDYHQYFNGKTISVEYESANTLISNSSYNLALTSITENEVNAFTRTMPYILYQDFGSITLYTQYDGDLNLDYPSVGGTTLANGDKGMVHLSGCGLSDWYATRVGTSAKTAVRICSRYQSGGGSTIGGAVGGTTNDSAQIISPKLSYLKAGATILVTYNFKGGRYSAYKTGMFGGWSYSATNDLDPYGSALYSLGIATSSPPSSGLLVGGESDDLTNYISSERLADTYGTNINGTQAYTSITNNGSQKITANGGGATRLVWTVANDYARQDFWGVNGNFWFYLDNVVVTIAK
ncbi:MAG: fimbrillin family protein [Rikenellaceae bacterium]